MVLYFRESQDTYRFHSVFLTEIFGTDINIQQAVMT